jgi:biopolymer transport protein ExbB
VKFSLYDTDKALGYQKELAPDLRGIANENLLFISELEPPRDIQEIFFSLQPPLTIYDAGIFIYPLGLCLFFAVFIFTERLLSLRRSVTFPRKVEKALKNGEFPNKKWKQKSSAERIVWVALHENPSSESLSSYKDLEISAMEKGFFILEVVISASPLIGLLGTVTGLVQVFSSISDINQGKDVLAEGIGLALLTTILGLAIAIPTLIGHSYLGRILDKRIASLNWVTSRINDARRKNPAEMM